MINKTKLLASASLILFANAANAFDDVNWTWNKDLVSTETKTVNINIDTDTTGMVQLEKIQAQIGDVTADSTVSGITNNTPGGLSGDATVNFDETVTINADFGKPSTSGNSVSATTPEIFDDGDTPLNVTYEQGNLTENDNNFSSSEDIRIEGTLTVDASNLTFDGANLAEDLPTVDSAATALGNNQTITSSVSTDMHDAQFTFGGFDEAKALENGSGLFAAGDVLNLGEVENTSLQGVAALTLAGALGIIDPANISANSDVSDITNASVDSTATALANNMSVELAAIAKKDAFLIADQTQFAYADVSATSSVTDVDVNQYSGFGAAGFGLAGLGDAGQVALVNSAATAIGNNYSLNVSVAPPVVGK